ncbi:MAG: GNAT family N-acetyltransferase [Pacificimonas sp.]|nr:GNAT family N-acetyltransferase [Pacificimonas sp.]
MPRRAPPIQLELVTSVTAIDAAEWNACAGDNNPFLRHEFFRACEESGSAVAETGWQPAHLCLREEAGAPLRGVLPGYVKSHSQGEYVFDHSWADALHRAGGDYYPKLQHSVPFTPATGPRILAGNLEDASALLSGAEAVCQQHGLSSAHATFFPEDERPYYETKDWLIRTGEQFHWFNRDYDSFEGFLGALSSRKRKTIRRERRGAADHGLQIVRLEGAEITEEDWDAFWVFYQDTGARKWGTPYLTRAAFTLFSELMPERLLLILAKDGDRPVAGALNFIGGDCLYGRYWGAVADIPFMHFELCYYQAQDIAIERGLARVEAGAQGAHKLARGYEPVETLSAHWIGNPSLRNAIDEFLVRERRAVASEVDHLQRFTPFKKG